MLLSLKILRFKLLSIASTELLGAFFQVERQPTGERDRNDIEDGY